MTINRKITALGTAGLLALASLTGCALLPQPLPASTQVGTVVEIRIDSDNTTGSIETVRNGLVIDTDEIEDGGTFDNTVNVKPGVTLTVTIHAFKASTEEGKPVNSCEIRQYVAPTATDDPDSDEFEDSYQDFPVLVAKKTHKGTGDLVCTWTAPGTYTPRPAPTPAIGQGPVEVMIQVNAAENAGTYSVDLADGQGFGEATTIESHGGEGQTVTVGVGKTISVKLHGSGVTAQILRYDAQADEDGDPMQVLAEFTAAKGADATYTWTNK